jgi:3-keto-5-aminohexanoate cleavage enzyme
VRTALVAAWSESWVADTDRSRRLFRLLFDDDGLRATWFKVITESEASWAQVIARRLGIDPNSQRAALIGAVVVAASRLSTKSFVDSGTDVDPDRRGHRRRDPHPGRLPACPHAYMYADYLRGDSMGEKNAHLQPMADAGVLRMVALDPGLTQFGHLGDDGLPSLHIQGGTTFPEAAAVTEFASSQRVALSVGIYEPGNLRWGHRLREGQQVPDRDDDQALLRRGLRHGRCQDTGGQLRHVPDQGRARHLPVHARRRRRSVDRQRAGRCPADTPIARYALERGGHLRAGVEDTAGATEMTNAETVQAAAGLAAAVGRPVAVGQDATAVLGGSRPYTPEIPARRRLSSF